MKRIDYIFISLFLLWVITFRLLANGVINTDLVDKYLELKHLTNCNYVITSGIRSEARNKAVGGVPKSYHLTGRAYDLVPLNGCKLTLKEVSEVASKIFNGVILYKRHVHVDIRYKKYHKL